LIGSATAQQIIKKSNAMINNFWSFSYIIRRFKEKAEECE
jgi:transposase